jgi:general secretion pathway protein D
LLASTEANKELDVSFASQGPQFKTPPDGFPPTPPLVVAPPPLKVGSTVSVELEQGADHFISDPKTGNLLMVVRRDALAKIKDLLRKLDIPKKMVQIEVMLFEKRIKNENSYGVNLLKLGSKKNGIKYTSGAAPTGRGVLEYLLHGHRSKHFPAYDLAMNFLMAQEDIQLHAAPSVITVNQTPATISVVEEISINNGAAPVDTNKGIAFEKSFSRAQFGITIVMTPTVHLPDRDDELSDGKGFVTLQTNVTFDTTKHHNNEDRPLVDRRHVENEVRVLDGQTVILGGLRRKSSHDNEEKILFIGDIPGLGKLFGSMKLTNNNTEMFIFITPTIVLDPEEQLIQIRNEEVKKRPGDIPEYLERVIEAQEKERKKYFQNSFKVLFGNSNV